MILSLLSCILYVFDLVLNVCFFDMRQELRESQRKQQAALEKLRGVKEEKQRELIRRKEQEEERKRLEEERRRKEEEEAQRCRAELIQ